MTQNLRCVEVCRRFTLLAAITLFSFITTVRAVNLVEEFYLPIPEWQVLQACHSITPSVVDTNFASITSILVTGDGTQINYDQWEDGYEGNLASPTNATTQIWGDGIDANGIAPGFTHDPAGLPAGTVIILSNSVASSPRVASQYYYDGRDRIGANKALVVTRAGWPSPTGPVFGGSAVVQPTIDWGTNYVSPVGQDMTDTIFKYCGFFVMASQDNTMVIIDPDGPGPLLSSTNILNQGESWFYPGGIRRGGTINASKPVEAHLICGDTINTFAIDWFTLYPQSDWSSSYYTPLPSAYHGATLYQTYVYLYNNTATPITMFCTNLFATNNFVLPANGGYRFLMPTNSGAVFTSAAGEKFTTLSTVANGSGGGNDTDYNWGFTPLPKGSLTTEAVAGWAPGTSDYSANGSPVWVTPTAPTRLYVDYHGDHAGPLTDPNGNKYDTNYDLTVFQSKTIYVPGTNSQTGLRVYTIDGTLLSAVWGEDPGVAGTGNPYLDLGNPVLPFPVPNLTKSAVIVTDTPPAGLNIGDTLLYTVQVDNKGLLPLGNTVVVDAPPPALNYLTNSTTFNGVPIPDSTSGTAFPLDTPGYTIPIILSGGTTIIQYKAVIVASGSIQNSAGIPGYNINVTNVVPAGAPTPSLFVSKTILSPPTGIAGVGQVMQFNLQVINNGTMALPNLSLTDNYPSNKFSYVSASITPNSAGTGQIVWTNLGTLATGTATNIIVSLLATNTTALGTNIATASSPGNTTNSGGVTFTNIAAPVAAVTVNKTVNFPASGSAGIGQTVQYNLQVYNSGYAVLTNLSLVDNFPRTNLSFVSASVSPDLLTATNLTWTNLGSFAVGQITNITVNFLTTNYTAFMTNFAVAASVGGATNTNSVILQLSHSGLTVTKTVLSPTNQPVNLGSNVVFRIVIRNSGAVAITNVPLEDTYSAGYFQYVSATIPPNSIAPGDLFWTNIAGLGGFPTNAVITNDVTLLVTGGATPAYNTAAANFAIDVNKAAVAPASSVVGVNTAAGSISGDVYNDPDQSGSLTSGDSPLQNVTLSLYSDPNGDGNPADGALLQTVVSDVNGYYELLNLSTGAFVVVQSLLPGYTGTAPANNRHAILIATLTASTNQNFFQYPVPTTTYSTVAGTVWNDVNDVSFFQGGDTGLTNVQVDLVQDLNTNGIVDAGESPVQTVFTATNGAYIFTGVTPGHYVIHETDLPGYISSGDTQGTNDSQIAVTLNNGITTNSNDFFEFYFGLGNTNNPPVAVPDFAGTLQNIPLTIAALANDNSPGGFSLAITNVSATNGIATIAGTNVLFTPALNFTGTATIGYTITNANGASTSLITVTVSPAANLALGKSAPASVFAVSNLTYTISVTNLGPSSASSVTVTDALPAGATFVSTSGGGVNTGGVVTWSVGTLTSNQVTNVTLTVAAPASGALTNVASGGSPTGDPNPTNNVTPPVTTTVTPLANLGIVKVAPATVLANSNFSYTITVTNNGPSTAASVVVTDTLPAGVTFVGASGSGSNTGGVVTWNLGTMTASQATNLTLTVTAPVTGVTLTNLANVNSPTSDPVPTNGVTPPVLTTVTPMADVRIAKAGPVGAVLGTGYNYTLTISNSGPSAASSLSVTDSLPAGLSFVSSAPVTTTNASNQAIWSVSSLNANSASNFTVTVVATQRGSLTNIASVGGPTFDPALTNNVTPPVVTGVTNRIPVAVNDNASTPKNVAVTVPVLANDSDADGDALTIVSVAPTNGLASISGTNVVFTPTNNFLGTAIIGYTITDGFGGTNTALIFVTVTNRLPLAANDSTSSPENIAVTVPVLVNDTDPDGDPLTIISVSPTNGTASISGTNVIFTPATNFVGTATAGYVITDGFGGTNSALITISVTNRPPVANPDTYSISENTSNNLPVLVNDIVVTPGGALSIISVNPTNGTASISGTNIVFVPSTNFLGTATVGYTITDGIGGTNTSLVTVTVTNIPPLANPDAYSMAENTTNTFTPLTNDIVRTSGGTLTIVSVSPTNGAATIVSGTNVAFTPTLNFLGTATIGYTITDGIGGTNTSLITISVTNRPPVANPDSYSVTENATNTLTPLVNDTLRTTGGTLSLVSVSPTNGTASISGTNVTFAPTLNFIGTATIGYTITDGVGGTNTSLITVTVTNIPPLANPDAYSMAENTTNTFRPMTNDVVGTTGGVLAIVSVSATNGTAAIIGGTNVIFTPTLNFLGSATIGYTITDGIGGTNTSLITISVTNRPPIANPDSYSVTENTTNNLPVLVNDAVVTTGGTLGIVSVSPTNGTATISGTNIVFTPTTNFLGTATIGYTITDGIGGTNTSLVTVLVTNIPPVANPDAYSMTENATNTLAPLVNDVVRTPGGSLIIVSVAPTNGTATIVGGTNITFTPTLNFLGTATVSYTITDGIGGTNTSLITVLVTNIPPLANPDAYSMAENTTNTLTPLVNDVIRTAGGVLSIVSVSPTNGVATIAGGTNVTFTPTLNFLGTATIGYTITDGIGGTNMSVITISITNRPPIANPDSYSITENTTNTLPVLINDVVVSTGGTLGIVSVSPTNGTATISGTNIVFTPTLNFLGTATIGYTITDGIGGTNSSLVTILVTNIPPVANPDAYSMTENTTNTLVPLVNDVVRTPGGVLSLVSIAPTNGTASISGTNVVFTPTLNFLGTATIGYTITDGIGGTNTALITITVTNIPPLANPDAYSMAENTTNTFSPVTNDVIRTPGGILSIVTISATNGTASIVNGTNVTFTPTLNFLGTATIGYTITDGIGGTNTSLITVSVTNRPPVANPDSYSVTENTTNNLPVLINDVVITAGGTLTIVSVNPTNGTASISGTNIVFLPATNFLGTATIGYTITDGVGGTNTSLVTVTVTNIPPLANPDGYTVFQDSTNTFSPLTNDVVRTPGGALSLVAANPTNGTATISGTNIIFTPTPGFTGTATIGYTITDGIGGTNSSLITVSVLALADLAVTKIGPAAVYATTNFTYTITITNMGPGTAANLSVTDDLPASITFVSATTGVTPTGNELVWPNLGPLAAHNWAVVTVTVAAPTNGLTLTNLASAGSPTSDPNPTNNTSPPVVTTVTPIADLVIAKTAAASVLAESNLTYTISVTNLGPSDAGAVVVTDALPAGVAFVSASGSGSNTSGVVTWNFGTLPASQSSNVTVTVIAPAGGTLTNIASVISPTIDTNLLNNTNPPVITTVTPVADLRLGKTGPASVFAVSNLTYTISVTNSGPSSASSVMVTDALPAGTSFVSAPGGVNNSGTVTWSLGTLASNQVATVSLTVIAPASGSLTNVASGGSPTGDPNPTNNVTPPVVTAVAPLAALTVAKVGPATVLANSNFSYTISVTNFGPSSASSVTMTDALPAGVIFVNASASGSNTAGVVTWNLGTLSSNQVTNVTVTVTSPASGSLTNVASVGSPTGDPAPSNNVTPPVITGITPVADVSLVKTGPAMVLPGTNFVYSIMVTNSGPSGAANLSVTDNLPANVALVSATAGSIVSGGQIIWTNLGTLAANATISLSITVTAPVRGSITNTAGAGSPTLDPVPTNNVTPPVTTLVSNLPPVAVNDLASTPVNVAVTVYPLVNDFDTNGDTLSIIGLNPTNGTATFTATNVLFAPTLNFLGTATVGYTISDGDGGTASAIIFISVTNRPPVANDDVVSGTNGQAQIINPLLNDTDPDGDALTITSATSANGVVTINGGNTSLTYTPTNNGTCIINYSIADGRGGSDSAFIMVNVGSLADLLIAKVGPASVLAASNFSYTISVTNLGPSSAAGVLVTDTLPAGVTFISASGGGTNNNGLMIWILGTMTASQATNLTLTVTAPATGVSLTNVASVGSPTGDPVPTNNLTPPVITGVTPVADVSVVKAGPAGALFGTNYNYTLTVSNGGPSTAASLSVTDSLPAGLTLVTSVPLTTTNASNQVIWNLGNIAAGVTSNLNLTVISTQRGSLTNIASVGGPTLDPTPTNNLTPPVVTTVTNYAPVANPDLQSMAENTSGTFGPLTNDVVRTPGGVLTIVGVSTTNGSASVLNSTNISFAPATNFTGLTTLIYTITDNVGGTNSSTLTVLVTNIPPLANPDAYSMAENTTNTLTPLVNDVIRTAGGVLSIVSVSPTNGVATIAGGTNVTFTPTLNFLGTATIGYTITDGIGGTNMSVITISITNRPPIANPDSYSITENTTNTLPVLINDVVVSTGGTLGIVSVSPTNGTATISGTNIVFTPTLNFLGTATIGYTITDGIGGTNSSLVTILVTNIPPVANPDAYSMTENTTNTLVPLVNDVVRTPGGVLSLVSIAPTNGTASISGTNVVFTPTLNFLGTATIGYTITDGIGGTNTALITITVTNMPPLANPDAYSMMEDGTNTLTPLVNDLLRTPSGTLSIVNVNPTNGTAGIVGGTNVIFIPTHSFVGVTTIGYTITDGIGGTNASVITVTVTNQSPIAFPQSLSTTENTALPLTLNGGDPVGRPLTFIIAASPAHGILTGLNANTGAVIYTPTNNFLGTDTFTFHVNNGVNNSSNATITIAVTPVADLLVQQAGPVSGIAGSNLVFTVAVTNLGPAGATNLVVTNDIDAGFTFVSASASGANAGGVVTWTIPALPANGKTNLTVTVFAVEGGTFTNIASGFNDTPDLNTTNNDGSLTNAQVITIVSALADMQVFKTGSTNVLAGGMASYAIIATNAGPSTAANVVVQDRLPVGAALQTASGNYVLSNHVIVWSPANLAGGTLTNFTVTLTAPFTGTLTNSALSTSDTPDPSTNNNNGSSSNSIVRTVVTPVADLVVGKAGAAAGVLGVNFSYTISVTNLGPSTAANFSVTDSLPAGIVFVSALPPTTTNAASQVIWTNLGTLAANATTNLTLTVKAVMRGAVTNIATMGGPTLDPTPTNNVSPPVVTDITNRPPLAVDDSGSTPKNMAITVPVLANDSDPDGDALIIVSVSPANGLAVVSGTNVVFTPTNNFLGTAVIGYTITDGFGGTNSALITINVTNRPPVAVNDFGGTPKNVAVTVPVLANDSDPDGDALTIVSVSPTNGLALISGTNVVFTPTNNFLGTAIIGYTITDGFGGTNSALIFVAVMNRVPVALNDAANTPKNVAVTVPVLANDSDPDGDALTIISVNPTNGLAVISGTNVVFTPTNNFLGTAVIGYRIIDGFGGTNSALIFVTVTNRAPLAMNDGASTPKNVAVTVPVLANDSDPDGDALTIIAVSPTNGLAVISGTNVIFTPTNNFLGTTFIGYTIRDNFGGTNSALIAVLVTNRAPVAVNDVTSTPKNVAVTVPVLLNDSDPDGDALTIISVSPTNGLAVISGTNVIYTPTNSFIGTATVGYAIIDGFGGTNSAVITINVTNRPPVANSQSVATTFNTAKAITLTGGDADGDPLTYIIAGAPANGVLSLLDTNAGTVTYTPTNNFNGVDTFTFRVNDGTANSAVATVTITVGTPITADLAVFKAGPTNGVAGSNLVYTITVTNIGPSNATNVLVRDPLPAGFAFVSAVPSGVTVTSNVVNWAAFKLAAHTTTNFTVTATSAEGGTYTNVATAGSDAFDPNPTNNDGSLTNSQVRTVISPLADVEVFKDGGTNVAAGGVVNYTITATNSGPSTATNVVVKDNLPPGSTFQSASGSFSVSNNVVSWAAMVLTNGASTNFTIALTAPASGLFTNIALATSTTPDPNPTNNNGSFNKSRVATKVVPVADLVVLVFGPTNAVVGSNFVYSLVLSNAGPSVASNTVVSDALPTNLVFVSASSGGTHSNNTVTWPPVASLAVGGTTNYTITVFSPLVGIFTNLGSAVSATFDPNPTNNTGVLPASQVLTSVTFAEFSWLAGTPVFNPQTGLYEETVIVTNAGTGTVAGFQLYVTVLTPNVYLWNATGTNASGPYVQYSFPVDPSNHVSLALEFYDPFRVAFTNLLNVVPVIPAPVNNVGTNGSVAINTVFTDTRTNGTRFVIEFASVPGKTYTIIYSSDMVTWKVATPSVTANANVTQWYDDGPPKTESQPISVGTRFYRVIQN